MEARENYFLILELDPDEKDADKIEKRIKDKQGAWALQANNPSTGLQAKLYMSYLPDMREVMKNAGRRQEEALKAKPLLEEFKKAAAAILQQGVSILENTQETIQEQQVKDLAGVAEIKRFFTLEQVRARFTKPIGVAPPTKTYEPGEEPLGPEVTNPITSHLKVVNKKDLYEFLGCPRTSAMDTLKKRSDELYDENKNNNNKTPQVTASQELAHKSAMIFGDDAKRKRYNRYLDLKCLEAIRKLIVIFKANKFLQPAQVETMLVEAGKLGVPQADALIYVHVEAKKLGLEVLGGATVAASKQQCSCGFYNGDKDLCCGQCGRPLKVNCPKCQRSNPAINPACTGCGFQVGNAPLVVTLVQEANQAWLARNIDLAQRRLLQARGYWPDHVDVEKLLREIEQEVRQIHEAGDQVARAIQERRFKEARRLWEDWKKLKPPQNEVAARDQAIAQGYQRGLDRLSAGRKLLDQGQPDKARSAFQEALAECADLPEAATLSQQCDALLGQKASARDRVEAALADRRFEEAKKLLAEWKKHQPAAADVAALEQPILQGLESARHLVVQGRALLKAGQPDDALDAFHKALRECKDLDELKDMPACPPLPPGNPTASAGNRLIVLKWDAPTSRRLLRYRVIRKTLAALAGGDTHLVGLTADITITDKDVEPGVIYQYAIASETNEPDVKPISSAQPAKPGPVVALGEVEMLPPEQGDQQVKLTWKPPPGLKGLEIRRAEGGKPAEPGKTGGPDFTLVPKQAPTGLVDRGLSNETTYFYRVSAIFTGPDGKDVVTPGETVSGQPLAPAVPLSDIQARFEQGMVITWTSPKPTPVKVLRTRIVPGTLKPGQTLSLLEVDQLGTDVKDVEGSQARDPAPRWHEPFYLVFSLTKQQAHYAGIVQFLELGDIEVKVDDNQVRLDWSWPPNAKAVSIQRLGPSAGQPGWVAQRQEGSKQGSLTIRVEQFSHGDQALHLRCQPPATGKNKALGPGRVIKFRVQKPISLRWQVAHDESGVKLVLLSDQGFNGLGSLTLVGKINRSPREDDFDFEILTWSPSKADAGKKRLLVDIDKPEIRKGSRLYSLLLVNPKDAAHIDAPAAPETIL